MKKGFTLIELLIVITIIGILAVAFLPTILGAPSKARDTQRIADLEKLSKALINGNLEGIAYPIIAPYGCVSADASFDGYKTSLGGELPVDPQNDNTLGNCIGTYLYNDNPYGAPQVPNSGTYEFILVARVENRENANLNCNSSWRAAFEATTVNSGTWCYGLTVK